MTDHLKLLAPAIVLGAFVIGLLFIAVYLLLGAASARMRGRREEVSPRFLQETASSLLPWEARQGLGDLSSLCHGKFEFSALGGGMYHSRGTLQSCTNTSNAWLAYTVNSQRGNGAVTLRTSANELILEVMGGTYRQAIVKVDGRLLGMVRMASSSEMLDPVGQPLGRVTGGRFMTTYGMTNYRDVELNGRRVAEINSNLLHPWQRPGPPPPAFRFHAPELSADEEWWLLALLALELYFDRNRLNLT